MSCSVEHFNPPSTETNSLIQVAEFFHSCFSKLRIMKTLNLGVTVAMDMQKVHTMLR